MYMKKILPFFLLLLHTITVETIDSKKLLLAMSSVVAFAVLVVQNNSFFLEESIKKNLKIPSRILAKIASQKLLKKIFVKYDQEKNLRGFDLSKDNINATDEHGQTPLHIAAQNFNKPLVNLLLAMGANFDMKDKNGNEPLDLVIQTTLSTEKSEYALRLAIISEGRGENGKQEMLKKLEVIAVLQSRNPSKDLIKDLIKSTINDTLIFKDRKIEINNKIPLITAINNNGRKLRWKAVCSGVNLLCLSNAKGTSSLSKDITNIIIDYLGVTNFVSSFSKNLKIQWKKHHSVKLFTELTLPLAIAITYCKYGKEVVQFVLDSSMIGEHGLDINNSSCNLFNSRGKLVALGSSLLHSAALNGSEEITKLLLENGANPKIKAKNVFHDTPLHCAAESGSLETTRLLIEAIKEDDHDNSLNNLSACVGAESSNNETPLSIAKERGHEDIVNLFERG